MVRVRLFAALREAASASEIEAPGKTVGEVVDALSARFGERFAAVAGVSSFVVNGERATRSTPIAEGDEVALLPPVSGGACGRGSSRTTMDDVSVEAHRPGQSGWRRAGSFARAGSLSTS